MSQVRFIFDLDDTLYYERDYVLSGLNFVGALIEKLYGVKHAGDALLNEFNAGNRDPIGLVCQQSGIVESTKLDIVYCMRGHHPEIEMPSETSDFIQQLRSNSMPFGILTDGRSITQRSKLAALGLLDAAFISISEEQGFGKPDRRCYEQFYQVFPNCDLIYVADNPKKDFHVPNRLNWTTIMLRDQGHNIHSQADISQNDLRAKIVIDRFSELNSFLRG